jgi:hypothetical protein
LLAWLLRLAWLFLCLASSLDAIAAGVLSKVPILSTGFILDTNGSMTSTDGEVIDGHGSVKGSYSGTNSYNAFLHTDPAIYPLTGGHTYTVTFRYKILTAPDKGVQVLFYSPIGGNAGLWLPSINISGVAGDTGTATLTNTLGPYDDYRAHWTIVGSGEITIDDVQLTDVTTDYAVVNESFEQTESAYVFPNPRTAYLLNLSASATDVVDKDDNSHTLVPYGEAMSFAGARKFSKNSSFMVHNVRSHAETYADWSVIADLPVDFLRTSPNFNYGPDWISGRLYPASASKSRFPDRADKAVVGYVSAMEFSPGDLAFDASWDKNGDRIIDPGITALPSYVDTKVFNTSWKNWRVTTSPPGSVLFSGKTEIG